RAIRYASFQPRRLLRNSSRARRWLGRLLAIASDLASRSAVREPPMVPNRGPGQLVVVPGVARDPRLPGWHTATRWLQHNHGISGFQLLARGSPSSPARTPVRLRLSRLRPELSARPPRIPD